MRCLVVRSGYRMQMQREAVETWRARAGGICETLAILGYCGIREVQYTWCDVLEKDSKIIEDFGGELRSRDGKDTGQIINGTAKANNCASNSPSPMYTIHTQ